MPKEKLNHRDWVLLGYCIKLQGERPWFSAPRMKIVEATGVSRQGVTLGLRNLAQRGAILVVEQGHNFRGSIAKRTVLPEGYELYKKFKPDNPKKKVKKAPKKSPNTIESLITNAQCRTLRALLKNGRQTNGELAKFLKISKGTVDSQLIRLAEYEMITNELQVINGKKSRVNEILPAGRRIVKLYEGGRRFKNPPSRQSDSGFFVDKEIYRAPKWTHGNVFEDARVRMEIPRFIPHAVSMPFKGKDSLAE